MTAQGQGIYEFGPFRLDAVERMLVGDGQPLTLSPKALDLLIALVSKAGHVVDKDQLMREVWPDTFVEDNNLTVNMSALRKALDPHQDYIQTVPRKGYRFVGVVRHAAELPLAPGDGTATESASAVLVGRQSELSSLDCLLRKTVTGNGCMVFITGEPGIGKTALCNTFLDIVRCLFPSALLCQGRCLEQYGVSEPYLPVLDLLSNLLSGPNGKVVADVLRSSAPTWRLHFPSVFGTNALLEDLHQETLGATKARMLREVVDALSTLASTTPVVLHFEDLHWADPLSIDLLRRLCQETGRRRLLVTGTFRPEDVERSNGPMKNFLLEMQAHNQCMEIALGLLSRADLEEYLNTRFVPNRFDSEFASLIHRKTEGQPLFATSLIQLLVERGVIAKPGDQWMLMGLLSDLELDAPVNVRKMISKKLNAVGSEDRRAIGYASIQGYEFNSVMLAALLEMDELELEERLNRLDKVHKLIQTLGEEELPDGTFTTRYRFAHVLYQNDLYGELLNKRRVQLHRQTGDLMIRHCADQAPRFAVQLATHFECGRDFARTVEFLIHAGEHAQQIYAFEKAVEHFTRALSFVPRIPPEQQNSRLLTIHQKRAAAHVATGQFERAVEDLQAVVERARETNDRVTEHNALNGLAEVHFYSHHLDQLEQCATAALGIARELADERLRVETMVFIAMKQDITGDLVHAKSNLDEIIMAARALNFRKALLDAMAWRGHLYFFQSEYDLALEMLHEARDLAAELGHAPLLLQTRFFLGLSMGNLGRFSEALRVLQEATALAQRNGDQYWQAKIPNCIAWIFRELGDFDRARECDLEGLAIARANKVNEGATNSLINLGGEHIRACQPDEAMKSFEEAASIMESDVWFRWRFTLRWHAGLAAHHLSRGQLDTAVEHAKVLLESATRYEARKYIAVAHKLLAEVAYTREHLVEAEGQLILALEQLASHSVPILTWKIHSMLGELRLQMGNQCAGKSFDEASAIVWGIASNIEDEALRESFLAGSVAKNVLQKNKGNLLATSAHRQ
jgi:predicted ATPase